MWDDGQPRVKSVNVGTTLTRSDETLHDLVETFWEQEHFAILPEKDTAYSVEDSLLLQKLESETVLEDGHYVVPMLWDDNVEEMPNNLS